VNYRFKKTLHLLNLSFIFIQSKVRVSVNQTHDIGIASTILYLLTVEQQEQFNL